MSDHRDVAAWCEQGDAAAFPQPDGSVAFVAQNDVDLAACFTKHTYNRMLDAYLRDKKLDAA